MIQPTHNPQAGPARALLELLTEHPELPVMNWQILGNGALMGSLHGLGRADLDTEVAAWAEFLNTKASGVSYLFEQEMRSFRSLYATWRDIGLSLAFYAPAADEVEQVAA